MFKCNVSSLVSSIICSPLRLIATVFTLQNCITVLG